MTNPSIQRNRCFDIIGAIQEVHRQMGPGLSEKVYQEALEMEFKLTQIPYQREISFHPTYKNVEMEALYKLDFLCKGDIVIELKSVSDLCSDHRSQLFNYMRLRDAAVGILVNFGPKYAQIETYLYDSETKEILTRDGKPLNRQLFTKIR